MEDWCESLRGKAAEWIKVKDYSLRFSDLVICSGRCYSSALNFREAERYPAGALVCCTHFDTQKLYKTAKNRLKCCTFGGGRIKQ